jgi:hypothetical protein
LKQIEYAAFARSHPDLAVVPGKISFIAGDAFPEDCIVTMSEGEADGDSFRGFEEWRTCLESGSRDAFERRV